MTKPPNNEQYATRPVNPALQPSAPKYMRIVALTMLFVNYCPQPTIIVCHRLWRNMSSPKGRTVNAYGRQVFIWMDICLYE